MSVSSIPDVTTGASEATAASSSKTTEAASAARSGLGQDAFLRLLVTQLEYQDPTRPQDSSAFIAQLATFASLEKLTAIDSSLKTLNQLVAGSLLVDMNNTPTSGAAGGAK